MKDIHPEKRTSNGLKRLSGQVFGIVMMILFKRAKHEIMIQLLAANGALKKIISVYYHYLKREYLVQRIKALLSLKNLPASDAETLKNISVELNEMNMKALLKACRKIAEIEQQIQQQNTLL